MTNTHKLLKVLLAFDFLTEQDPTAESWSLTLASSLINDGCEVTYLARETIESAFHRELAELGVSVILAQAGNEPDSTDEFGVLPRYRARQLVRLARETAPDLVIVQGEAFAFQVSASEICPKNLWAIVEDSPTRGQATTFDASRLKTICAKARVLLVSDERCRAQIEASCREAISKTRLLPHFYLTKRRHTTTKRLPSGPPTYVVDSLIFNQADLKIDFSEYSRLTRGERQIPRLLLCGFDASKETIETDVVERSGILDVPGLIVDSSNVQNSEFVTAGSKLIVPEGLAPNLIAILEHVADSNSLKLLEFDSQNPQFDGSEFVGRLVTERSSNGQPSFLEHFLADLPDYATHPLQDNRLKIVLAGADFKFAGDLTNLLVQREDVELRLDVFESNSSPQPAKSVPFLRWADVVIAEFASFNAIWYSQNILPHQKLIVRLHGYELLSDWIDKLEIDRVDRIVVASNFYRKKALEMKDWPSDKIVVIPNSVNPADMDRRKFEDSRFHLGLVGIVPILKRPDRALDLLEKLVAVDERYVLHIKGHSPWNYTWEWKKSAHQDAYRAFYKALGERELLANVSFEPFSPDMGNWLRKIGWILSPSYRETFHMAAVEGGVSGAIPIAWERDGSIDIIGEEYNVYSTDEAFSRIMTSNYSHETFVRESAKAKEAMRRYSLEVVRDLWLAEVFDVGASELSVLRPAAAQNQALTYAEQQLYNNVNEEVKRGDVEGALSQLDEGIKLTVGKSGVLKDLELYVRGLAGADEMRLNHYVCDTESAAFTSPLVVQVKGTRQEWPHVGGFDRLVIDVELPLHLRTTEFLDLVSSDIQHDYAIDQVSTDKNLRFDRWVQFVKAALISHVLETGADSFLSVGGWEVAFASSLAADQLGLPFVWIPDERSLGLLNDRFSDSRFNDAEYELALSTWRRADARIALTPGFALNARVLRLCDIGLQDLSDLKVDKRFIELDRMAPLIESAIAGNQSSKENSLDLHFRLSELTVAVIGSEDFVNRLRSLVGRVIEMPITDYFEAIDAFVDVLIVDTAANNNGPWQNRVQFNKDQGRYPITKILDHGRKLGIPSVLIDRGEHTLSPKFFAAARKADCVSVTWLPALPTLLELNPSVNSSAFIWQESAEFEFNLRTMLRCMGIPVEQPAIPNGLGVRREVDLPEEEIELSSLHAVNAVESPIYDEKVSVILATYQGESTIQRMLDSVGAQTLPERLIQLIVIENGNVSNTKSIVEEFALEHPDLDVSYMFEKRASVGNARNVGIRAATGKYITFVDDDDYLEPDYLLSMWLSASDESVVIGLLADESLHGEREIKTPNNNRVAALKGGRQPLRNRSGLLGLNACKLIPSKYAKRIKYEDALVSGEDTVFMSQLLEFEDLTLVPCAPMTGAMYVRRMSDNSVSRQPESFDFCVTQRIAVINHLIETRNRIQKKNAGAINYLIDNQASFIRKYYSSNPSRQREVKEFISSNCIDKKVVRLD